MDQNIIDRAVNIATKCALNGTPVKKIVRVPPSTASGCPLGIFVIEYYENISIATTPPWEE